MSYLATLGPESARLVVAGDPKSPLLSLLDPASATAPHVGFGVLHAQLREWVVDCNASYFRSSIHPGGVLDPSSEDFHGTKIARSDWSFAECQRCHGTDFTGGTSERACTTCHAAGPTACATCHGADGPSSGAHRAHLTGGEGGLAIDCAECHVKPDIYTAEGHILRGGKADPAPAEVRFAGEGKAAFTPAGATRAAAPAFDPATKSCSNVYCHGSTLADPAAKVPEPTWTKDAAPSCDSCHGQPPANHLGGGDCKACHGQVTDAPARISNRALHGNGSVEVGAAGPATCSSCHGDPPQTGAHVAHVTGARLARPVACTECHVRPASVDATGHIRTAQGEIDGAPVEVTFGALARTRLDGHSEPAPSWDRSTRTCSNVYCHGAGTTDANASASPPSWTGGPSQAACGGCHGLPPASHSGLDSVACVLCHERVVNTNLEIIADDLHLDGKVSLGDDSTPCASCHRGPEGLPLPDFSGETTTAALGVGAHAVHVNAPSRISSRLGCDACHKVPGSVRAVGHIDSALPAEVFPAPFSGPAAAGGTPSWDRTTATCTSGCHGTGLLAVDMTPGLVRAPKWTEVGTGQARCGSCHGVPPTDAVHRPNMQLSECASCHPASIDPTGRIIVTGASGNETSFHVNGVVDVAR